MYDHLEEIENEFKEVHEDNEKNTPDPRTQAIYRNNLLLYLGYIILPIVLSIFIVIGLSDNDFFFKDVNPSEHAIEGAVSDVNALLFVDPTYFDNLDPLYQSFVTPVGSDGRITIYVHSSATFIDDTDFFTRETIGGKAVYTIDSDILDSILDGTTKKWPNNAEITFYVPKDDISPIVVGSVIDDVDILTSDGFLPTLALNAIFSFALMLIVAVPMLIISKPVIKTDMLLLKESKENVGTILSKAGIGILYMFAGNIAIGIIVMSLSSALGIPDQVSANQLAINLMLKSPYFILMIITAVIIGPIVEELVFRKSFFGLIKNETWALVISSLVFGLIHISTELIAGDLGLVLISSLPYIGGGFIFGYIYMTNKKNIVIPILAHMGYNLISVLISMFLLFNL